MKSLVRSLLFLSVLFLATPLWGQKIEYAYGFGGTSDGIICGSAYDMEGNLFITGYSAKGASFKGTPLSDKIYLAKLDPKGNLLWLREGNRNYDTQGTSLACDKEGNVYFAGKHIHGFIFDGIQVPAYQELFLFKYSKDGQYKWSKVMDSDSDSHIQGLAINGEGDPCLAGFFTYKIVIDSETVYRKADYSLFKDYQLTADCFLLSFDKETGRNKWHVTHGDVWEDRFSSIQSDLEGNLIVAGWSNTVKFNQERTTSEPDSSLLFVAKYSSSGQLLWMTKSHPTSIKDVAYLLNLAIDNQGNINGIGMYSSRSEGYTMGGVFFPKTGLANSAFVMQLSKEGEGRWIRTFQSTENRVLLANGLYDYMSNWQQIATNPAGDLFIAGTHSDTLRIDTLVVAKDRDTTTNNTFLVKLSSLGNTVWGASYGTTPDLPAYNGHNIGNLALSTNKEGKIALSGFYQHKAVFGPIILLDHRNGSDYYPFADSYVVVLEDTVKVKCPGVRYASNTVDTSFCEGNTLELAVSPPLPAFWRAWFKEGQRIYAGIDSLKTSQPGEYFLIAYKGTACEDTIQRVVVKKHPLPIAQPIGDTVLCHGEKNVFETLSVSDYKYQWSHNSLLLGTEATQEITKSGTYSLVVTSLGCVSKREFSVKDAPTFSIFKQDSLVFCQNETATLLSPIKGDAYQWSDGSLGEQVTITQSGNVSLTVKIGACSYADSLHVSKLSLPFVPNVFTPNGDGVNDTFAITGLKAPVEVTITNRWGHIVYQEKAYSQQWDGANTSDGMYFYAIKGDDASCLSNAKGWLQIIR